MGLFDIFKDNRNRVAPLPSDVQNVQDSIDKFEEIWNDIRANQRAMGKSIYKSLQNAYMFGDWKGIRRMLHDNYSLNANPHILPILRKLDMALMNYEASRDFLKNGTTLLENVPVDKTNTKYDRENIVKYRNLQCRFYSWGHRLDDDRSYQSCV